MGREPLDATRPSLDLWLASLLDARRVQQKIQLQL